MNDELILRAARATHEAIRDFNEALGDYSVVPWDEADDSIKQSSIDGVKFLIANPKATGRDIHANWVKFKIADGWKYGVEKNTGMKLHPSLAPYDTLRFSERMKDDIFISIARAHLSASESDHK